MRSQSIRENKWGFSSKVLIIIKKSISPKFGLVKFTWLTIFTPMLQLSGNHNWRDYINFYLFQGCGWIWMNLQTLKETSLCINLLKFRELSRLTWWQSMLILIITPTATRLWSTKKFMHTMGICLLFPPIISSRNMADLSSFQGAIVLEQVLTLGTGQAIMWQIGSFYGYQLAVISCSKYSVFRWLVLIFADSTVLIFVNLENTN